MARDIYFLIFYLQTFLSALIAVVSLYRFSQRNLAVRLIGILFVFSFICNVLAYLLFYYRIAGSQNIPGSLYDIITVLVVSIIFNFITKSKYRLVITTTVVIYSAAALLNLFFLQKLENASYNKLFGSFIIIVYTVYYFYRLIVELPTVHLQRLPMFWFISAFLIFHAGAIFLFAFTDYLVNVLKDNLITYWSFHNLLTILQQLAILVGLSYDLKNSRKVAVD